MLWSREYKDREVIKKKESEKLTGNKLESGNTKKIESFKYRIYNQFLGRFKL